MNCSNVLCRANVSSCLNFCHICGATVSRPPFASTSCSSYGDQTRGQPSQDTENEHTILEEFQRHTQLMTASRTQNQSKKKRRILSQESSTSVEVKIGRARSSGDRFIRKVGLRPLQVKTTDSISDILRKGLVVLLDSGDACGNTEQLLGIDLLPVVSVEGIDENSTLLEYRARLNKPISRITFYIVIETSEEVNNRSSVCATNHIMDPDVIQPACDIILSDEDVSDVCGISDNQAERPNNFPSDNDNVLELWKNTNICNEDCRIVVNRKTIWDALKANMKLKHFSLYRNPKIVFFGEGAIDGGGPRREFFCLLMDHLAHVSGLFEGPEDFRVLAHNVTFLDEKKYFVAGQVIAYSVLHGGPGICAFRKEFLQILTVRDTKLTQFVEFIEDTTAKTAILEVMNSSEQNWSTAVENAANVFENSGFPLIRNWKFETKEQNVDCLCRYMLYLRNSKAYDDLISGLNVVGNLWNTIEPYKALQELILCKAVHGITAEKFEELIDFQFSEEGSNLRNAENATAFSFVLYLGYLEDIPEEVDITLPGFLGFLTGSKSIPIFGFPRKITVKWFDQEVGVQRYPRVSTCSLTIELPRGFGVSDHFYEYMNTAILNGRDYFGQV